MPPQTLRSVDKRATAVLGSVYLGASPEIASLAMQAIATWAEIESELALILAEVLGAKVRPAMAMYSSLVSSSAQTAVLKAAAQASLSSDHYRLFDAIMTVAKPSQAYRNKLAHGLWAYSQQLPDAMILFDPETVLTHRVERIEYVANHGFPLDASKVKGLPATAAYVYRVKDLKVIIGEMAGVLRYLQEFLWIVHDRGNGKVAERYRSLCNERPIREALSRRFSGQKKKT